MVKSLDVRELKMCTLKLDVFVFLFHADNVNLTIVQGRLELLNPLLQLVNFTPKSRHAILTLHTITTTC